MRAHGYTLSFIAVVAWVANYLHFATFGLYEDDWFFVAFPFLTTFKEWMIGSLGDQYRINHFQGRPLQMLFVYGFAEIGALAKSIALDYLIAYVLFAASALLLYEVLRRRFSKGLATLAAILFVLTPLHTLHQFLGQYSVAPAFILVFLAILLYRDSDTIWAYFVAVLSLLSYESIFVLFLGAPLMRPGSIVKGRWREWFRHIAIFAGVVTLYFIIRKMVSEIRVAELPGGFVLVGAVLHACIFQTFASFATYIYAALRAHEASLEGWVYAVLFIGVLIGILRTFNQRMPEAPPPSAEGIRHIFSPALVGFLLLIFGYIASYFFFNEPTPHFHVTDRETRISIAASVGSSIFVAALLAGWIQISVSRLAKVAAFGGTAAFFLIMFLYSFVLQQDYIEEWNDHRAEMSQMMSLTPDVERDSLIVLELHVPGLPFFTSGRRRRAIGLEQTLYEYQFGNVYAKGQPWPRLFVVYADSWPENLKLQSDGLMHWKASVFFGRWYAASGDASCKPGRFIFLEEVEPGLLVRHSRPVFVDGQQIIQQIPVEAHQAPLWSSLRRTALIEEVLPSETLRLLTSPATREGVLQK